MVNINGSNNKGMNSEEIRNEFDPINLIQTAASVMLEMAAQMVG